jgi:hypothetical protein
MAADWVQYSKRRLDPIACAQRKGAIMAKARVGGSAQSVVDKLEERGVKRGILHQMAMDGQLTDLRCEMPSCFCPDGRKHFDYKKNPMPDWAPNPDHSPILRGLGGKLVPENVRLAHVLCNNRDFAWRKKVREMLANRLSLQEIAAELNRKKVVPPFGKAKWTAKMVRWAYV